jgi:hypothetical protein
MSDIAEVMKLFPGNWAIGKNSGAITEFQDLGSNQLGINLRRDPTKAGKSSHCAKEFGFVDMFASTPANTDIVYENAGETIKFSAGAKNFTATVDQISIHRTGAHARIVVSGIKP